MMNPELDAQLYLIEEFLFFKLIIGLTFSLVLNFSNNERDDRIFFVQLFKLQMPLKISPCLAASMYCAHIKLHDQAILPRIFFCCNTFPEFCGALSSLLNSPLLYHRFMLMRESRTFFRKRFKKSRKWRIPEFKEGTVISTIQFFPNFWMLSLRESICGRVHSKTWEKLEIVEITDIQ